MTPFMLRALIIDTSPGVRLCEPLGSNREVSVRRFDPRGSQSLTLGLGRCVTYERVHNSAGAPVLNGAPGGHPQRSAGSLPTSKVRSRRVMLPCRSLIETV